MKPLKNEIYLTSWISKKQNENKKFLLPERNINLVVTVHYYLYLF